MAHEYVDRSEVLKKVRYVAKAWGIYEEVGKKLTDKIKAIPAADVEPVKHGKWELCFEDSRRQIVGNKCSVCGYEYYGNKYFYCPNCGARMDGDK